MIRFLKNLFVKESDVSPEIQKIFKKIDRTLNNDDVQNAGYPEKLRSLVERGEPVDEVRGGYGDFGHTLTNPIPVNGPLGQITYLSKLRTTSGKKVFFHRLGSTKEYIDVYEIVSADGMLWDILFLDGYHPRKSRKTPTGYRMENSVVLLTGINLKLSTFPKGLHSAIMHQTKNEFIGFPLADKDTKSADSFSRPDNFIPYLQQVMSMLTGSSSFKKS